ncbi:MAG TPA: asparagine synthase (glutamine-hydrolyzing), partial [Thermoanaerobaculia bacterium]
GMFAFALWDRRDRRLDLVRDRLGQKPLYWAWTPRGFAFASELRALLAVPGFSPEIDRDALTQLLRRGAIAAPWSVFRGARKLQPGHRLRVTADGVAAGRRQVDERAYWSVLRVFEEGAARPLAGDDGELTDAVEALIGDAVEAATVSDVPLGAFLSGGVDSSLVVALLADRRAAPRTFTIGFGDPRYDESEPAAAIARHLGTRHETLHVGEDEALAVVPELPEIYDEPLADPSQVPTALLARLARRHVTVALSGDGGDERFAGYEHYRLLARLAALGRLPRPLLAGGAAALAWLPEGTRLARLGRFLVAARSPEEVHLRLVSVWKRPAELVIGAAEPPALLVRPAGWPRIADPVRRAQALDAATYLPDDVLAKVDRAAMAVSLETRVPLLDHRVVELAARLPGRLLVRGGRGKWVLRQVLARHLPAELVDRPKRGFSVPLDAWLRGALRDWAEALLAPERLRREGVFAVDAVRGVWEEHLAGHGDRGLYLWPLLSFQAWRERWCDGRGALSAPAGPARAVADG